MARKVFDVTGAGDTVAATVTLALAAGASLLESAILASKAAGVIVGRVGTAAVRLTNLMVDGSPASSLPTGSAPLLIS